MSELWASAPGSPYPCRPLVIGLALGTGLLDRRIRERVARMVRNGFVDEVATLLGKGYSPNLPSMSAVGYREVAAHVEGTLDLDEAVERTVRSTCRYARRQLRWFRADRRVTWFGADDLDRLHREVVAMWERARGGTQ